MSGCPECAPMMPCGLHLAWPPYQQDVLTSVTWTVGGASVDAMTVLFVGLSGDEDWWRLEWLRVLGNATRPIFGLLWEVQ